MGRGKTGQLSIPAIRGGVKMRQEIYNLHGKKYVRVTRPRALKAYLQGFDVFACMDKINLYSQWVSPSLVMQDEHRTEKGFTAFENELLYYNKCSELGYRAKYFLVE